MAVKTGFGNNIKLVLDYCRSLGPFSTNIPCVAVMQSLTQIKLILFNKPTQFRASSLCWYDFRSINTCQKTPIVEFFP